MKIVPRVIQGRHVILVKTHTRVERKITTTSFRVTMKNEFAPKEGLFRLRVVVGP